VKTRATFAILSLLNLLVACRQSWPPDVVAHWEGGSVDVTGIELYLGEALDHTQSGEDLVRQYGVAAQELCARDHLVQRLGADISSRFDTPDQEVARRQFTVNAFVRNRINPEIEVTSEEIEAFFSANPGYAHRLERRFVEHIFRRTGDPTGETAAREDLAEVRARFLEGEAFHTLAVEYSQSETAGSGGTLGLVSRGDLHEAAEETVFSLELGEISQPIPVHGGLAVFVVTQIYPTKDFPLADVRNQIAQQLKQERLRRRLDAIAEEATLPPGVHAVPEDSFHEILESNDPGAVLYSDASLRFSVDEWRERLAQGTADSQLAQYVDFLRFQKVYHFVVADGFVDEPGRREAIEQRLRKTLNDQMINLIAQDLMIEKAGSNPKALKIWYENNQERYQSQLELLINLIVVPPAGEVEDLANSLQRIASNYSGGDLEGQAESFRDSTVSHAWVGIAALDAYHPKVKASVLTLRPPACAPTFNIGNILHLFCLEDRKEPLQLSFDEAHDRVVNDYIAANEQELYAEIRDEILDDANFEFNETRVREILHAPAIQGANTP